MTKLRDYCRFLSDNHPLCVPHKAATVWQISDAWNLAPLPRVAADRPGRLSPPLPRTSPPAFAAGLRGSLLPYSAPGPAAAIRRRAAAPLQTAACGPLGGAARSRVVMAAAVEGETQKTQARPDPSIVGPRPPPPTPRAHGARSRSTPPPLRH